MLSLRKVTRSQAAQRLVGALAGEYLRFVRLTSRLVLEPAGFYEAVEPHLPAIVAMWHGQHFMVPFFSRGHRVKVLISRHRDGTMNAIAAERLGVLTIRGSGDHDRRFDLKGGVGAFMSMMKALQEGYNMALTADVPKVSRVAGLGIIKLGQLSGRPIYPVAVNTSRRIVLKNWDRTTINLPFSRFAIVVGEPTFVPADADDELLETCRVAVQTELDRVTARATAICDRRTRDDAT